MVVVGSVVVGWRSFDLRVVGALDDGEDETKRPKEAM
jgi:hypothetical protein